MAVLRVRQLVLLILLGCSEGLGLVFVFVGAREERSGIPIRLTAASILSCEESVLCCHWVDLALRCTWSFKLSPHLDHFNDLEGGIFMMEALEVFRRWMWIFLRVETEWVRNNRGPASDDVLLGDFGGKIDED